MRVRQSTGELVMSWTRFACMTPEQVLSLMRPPVSA